MQLLKKGGQDGDTGDGGAGVNGPRSDTGREREGLKAISAPDPGVQGTDPEGVESH